MTPEPDATATARHRDSAANLFFSRQFHGIFKAIVYV